MRKIYYIILFLLFILSSQAQKYEFDLLTKYNSISVNFERESLVYSNSRNQNYFLYVERDSLTKHAKLYDIENKTLHNFSILESKQKNELFFEFKYLDSKAINQVSSFNNYEFDVKTINSDSINKVIKIELFKNKKRKKPEMISVLKVKNSNNNLFPLFRFSCLHPFEFNRNLNIPENVIVESATETLFSGIKIEHKLLYFKEIKLEIQIPKTKIK